MGSTGRRQMSLRLAGMAGQAVGMAGRVLPGLVGAFLVSFGLWLAWQPLGWIAAGGFFLLLDRRMP